MTNDEHISEEFERARLVFHDALDVPTEERESFLQAVCAGEPKLLAEVKDLLRHSERPFSRLDATIAPPLGENVLTGASLGPYELGEVLGEGGMGVVYCATDTRTGRQVAVKVLRTNLSSQAVVTRFRLEVLTLKRLKGDGIAELIDAGTEEVKGQEITYYVMERVEGESLRNHETSSVSETVALIADICGVMSIAHAKGIIHRDIKPENIIVRSDGRPVVLDFGISRTIDPTGRTTNFVTSTGHVLGTVGYMSPEQLTGNAKETGAHSDVYSLGVVAFELLTGSRPYEGASRGKSSSLTQATALLAIEQKAVPLASSRRRELSPKLDAILCKALQPETAKRYATARGIERDLRAYLSRDAISAPRQTHLRRGWSRARRAPRKALYYAIVAATIILLAGFVMKNLRDSQEEQFVQYSLTEIWSTLQDVERDLHLPGYRTEESIRRSIDDLSRCRKILDQMPSRPFSLSLRRFVEWRSGEARYFLGRETRDLQELRLAYRHWSDAHNYHVIYEGRANIEGLPSTGKLPKKILQITNAVCVSGRATATEAIAEYENRADYLKQTLTWREAGCKLAFAGEDSWQIRPGAAGSEGRFAVLDYAISLIKYGATVDSLSVVDQGISTFSHIDKPSLWQTRQGAYASGQHAMGMAFQYRWRQTHDQSDWDAAESRFRHALAIHGEGSGSDLYRLDRVKLAQLHLEKGRVTQEPDLARQCFEAARAEILRGHSPDRFEFGTIERSDADLIEAEVLAEIAQTGETPEELATRSDSLLLAAAPARPRAKYPLQFAESQMARARVLLASQPMTDDGVLDFERALDAVEEIVPGGIWPELLNEATRLREAGLGRR